MQVVDLEAQLIILCAELPLEGLTHLELLVMILRNLCRRLLTGCAGRVVCWGCLRDVHLRWCHRYSDFGKLLC